jgi:hypothetical protein
MALYFISKTNALVFWIKWAPDLQTGSSIGSVDVQYEKKQVVVTFDEAKKNIDALVKATTNAGYPSQPEKDAR